MRLCTERCYRFPGDVDTVWTALGATDQYQRWWPWLRQFEARGLFTGDSWRCLVKPPLPYSLRFTVRLDDVTEHRSVAATITGDIAGVARLELTPRDDTCEIRLTSELSPRSRTFAMFAALARPLVKRGHDWVLDTGAAQFAAAAVGAGDRPRPQR
jgi:uncharacterized protein YndB with AHSA1/START domain